jgi:hypothetical protein
MACDECRALLGGYVLDALEPEEMDAVREHVASCAECSREHASLAPLPALLDAAGSAEPEAAHPPATLEDAVLDRFARDRPRVGAPVGAPVAGTPLGGQAGGAPLADADAEADAESGATTVGRDRLDPGRRSRSVRTRLRAWLSRPIPAAVTAAAAAALVTLALSDALGGSGESGDHEYGALLRGSASEPAARAYASLRTGSAGTEVDLRVRGMRPAPGTSYELWCVGHDGTRISAGTFRVDDTGHAHVHLTTAARLGEYERLSVERLAPGRPGRRVLAGSIEY